MEWPNNVLDWGSALNSHKIDEIQPETHWNMWDLLGVNTKEKANFKRDRQTTI